MAPMMFLRALVTRAAKGDDALTAMVRRLASQARVPIGRRRSSDVGTGEEGDALTIFALA